VCRRPRPTSDQRRRTGHGSSGDVRLWSRSKAGLDPGSDLRPLHGESFLPRSRNGRPRGPVPAPNLVAAWPARRGRCSSRGGRAARRSVGGVGEVLPRCLVRGCPRRFITGGDADRLCRFHQSEAPPPRRWAGDPGAAEARAAGSSARRARWGPGQRVRAGATGQNRPPARLSERPVADLRRLVQRYGCRRSTPQNRSESRRSVLTTSVADPRARRTCRVPAWT